MGFPRQEHWTGLPFPSPRDLFNPGIEPTSPVPQAVSLPSEPPGKPQLVPKYIINKIECLSERESGCASHSHSCFKIPVYLSSRGTLETCSASSKNWECLSTFILHGHREVSLGNGAACPPKMDSNTVV